MNKRKEIFIYIGILFSGFFLDRLTKWWALSALQDGEISFIPNIMRFSFVWNRGVSWSFFSPTSSLGFYLLSSVIVAVVVAFAIYMFFEYKKGLFIGFEFLVLSGALSNLYDRFVYGAVIDFIDCYIKAWHWPTFNIADACIVIGVIGIAVRGIVCNFSKT